MSFRKIALLLCLLLGVTITSGLAQTVTGTLQGTVRDQQEGVLPGAAVHIRNHDTGLERRSVTNNEGFYQFRFTPVGIYSVSVEMPGFKKLVRPETEVRLNETRVLDMSLELSPISETVTVTGDAPQINSATQEVKNSLSEQLVENMPLINRSYAALATVLPGFQENPISGQNNPTASSGSSFNFNGTGTRGTTFQTDGVNNDDSSENQHRQGVNISTIKEFQVVTNSYSAEFGRGFGAVVLTQTKSGTNHYHGDVYYYHRNAGVSARPFFAARRAPFIRHQYGATFGGPAIQDKLFYFGSFEQVKVPGGQTVTRDILLPDERAPRVDPSDPTRAPKEAFIKNVIDRFPNATPNRLDLGPRAYQTVIPIKQPAEDYSGRVDWNVNEKNNAFFRYQYSHQLFTAGEVVRGEQAEQNHRQQNFGATFIHVFTPLTVAEARFAVGRRRTLVNIKDGNNTPIIRFVGTRFPSIIGNAGSFPINRFQTDFQYVFNVSTILSDKHNLKFGTDTRRQQLNDVADNFSRGFFNFRANDFGDAYANFLRGFTQDYTQAFGPFRNGYRMFESNLYVQDDIKVKPHLTLNLGLRYELVTAPKEVNNLLDLGIHTDKDNWEPRVGLAWAPAAKEGWIAKLSGGPGQLSIRAGYGLMHGRLFQSIFSQGGASVRFNPPNAALIGLPIGNYPVDRPMGDFVFRPGLPSARVTFAEVDSRLEMPYTQQWNFTVERHLAESLALSVAYVGNRGIGLLFYDWDNRAEFPTTSPVHPFNGTRGGITYSQVDPNLANSNPPAGLISISQPRTNERRPNPLYSNVTRVSNLGWSYYHGLQTSLKRRYRSGLAFQINYTFSKATETGLEATFVGTGDINAAVSRTLGPRSMKGLSRFHQRHRFVANYTCELPFLRSQEGVLGRILGGWQVNGVTTFASGNPFTVFLGYDLNADGIGGDRPDLVNPGILGRSFDHPDTSRTEVSASDLFQTDGSGKILLPFRPGLQNIGSLGRNTFFLHGIANWDIGMQKNFKVVENHKLTFRVEMFNAFNRSQFGQPAATLIDSVANTLSTGQISSNFGRITSQRNSPRQIQASLRYVF
ncbi:MAG: TonB-dependent receptor [Acidobacteria bacterium]|nr:TonB-dependent receptor [Acidobacteriota bacterium]